MHQRSELASLISQVRLATDELERFLKDKAHSLSVGMSGDRLKEFLSEVNTVKMGVQGAKKVSEILLSKMISEKGGILTTVDKEVDMLKEFLSLFEEFKTGQLH